MIPNVGRFRQESPYDQFYQFIVICRNDRVGRRKGAYQLATRRVFSTRKAAVDYAEGISPSRQPIVVPGDFSQLRFDPPGKLGA